MNSALRSDVASLLVLGFQGTQVTSTSPIARAISEEGLGGVILFNERLHGGNNITSPEQLRALTTALQSLSEAPLFIGVDYEGGQVSRLPESAGFVPTCSAKAVAMSTKSVQDAAINDMASSLRSLGITLNFAPVVDLDRCQNSTIISARERSFSGDVSIVRQLASAYRDAYRQAGVIVAYKHYPGHGSAQGDTHEGCVDLTQTWSEEECLPYYDLDQYDCVMVGHLVNRAWDPSGMPATFSAPMLEYLRGTIGFTGVVISDDLQMRAITDSFSLRETVTRALNAGVDVLLFGNQLAEPLACEELVTLIVEQVEQGYISTGRIQEACARVARLRHRLEGRE